MIEGVRTHLDPGAGEVRQLEGARGHGGGERGDHRRDAVKRLGLPKLEGLVEGSGAGAGEWAAGGVEQLYALALCSIRQRPPWRVGRAPQQEQQGERNAPRGP